MPPRCAGRCLRLVALLCAVLIPSRATCTVKRGVAGGGPARRLLLTPRRGRSHSRQLPSIHGMGMDWQEYAAFLRAKEAGAFAVELPPEWKWDEYHSSAEVNWLLGHLGDRWPQLATVERIGNSYEGRELWSLQIGSLAARSATGGSAVQLIGAMHGDEAASCEILLRFAWDLCRRYGHSEDDLGITRMLDTLTLHLLPIMNPDGYDARPRIRENAQGVDLNRAFPRMGKTAPKMRSDLAAMMPSLPLPPEVAAVMNWTLSWRFPLSANLHGGALVASYPFDACDVQGQQYDCPTPEDPTPYRLARAFADEHIRMQSSPEFLDGVVRGSEWYPLLGGMQVRNVHQSSTNVCVYI
mmetsp:Transcript_10951/g.27679  ORF Transcript_10951/g.27679 Transcript_10951/m.27679 type:complete len:354 (-) Transcript_10951:897-1958(-)